MKTHTCALEECEQQIEQDSLMCSLHWARVPQRIKRMVWDTYQTAKQHGNPLLTNEPYQEAVSLTKEAVRKGWTR